RPRPGGHDQGGPALEPAADRQPHRVRPPDHPPRPRELVATPPRDSDRGHPRPIGAARRGCGRAAAPGPRRPRPADPRSARRHRAALPRRSHRTRDRRRARRHRRHRQEPGLGRVAPAARVRRVGCAPRKDDLMRETELRTEQEQASAHRRPHLDAQTLWERGGRARRRDRALAVGGTIAAATALVVGGVTVQTIDSTAPDPRPPATDPTPPDDPEVSQGWIPAPTKDQVEPAFGYHELVSAPWDDASSARS